VPVNLHRHEPYFITLRCVRHPLNYFRTFRKQTMNYTIPHDIGRWASDTILHIGVAVLLALGCLGSASAQSASASAPVGMAVAASAGSEPVSAALPTALSDNPYGLAALWAQGDWVAKGTLILLLIMSLASWYILISRFIGQGEHKKHAREAQRVFSSSKSVRQIVSQLSVGSAYKFVTVAATDADARFGSMNGQVDLNTWLAQNIENAVGTIQSRQQSGLAELATIGSTAPFVGLFGTVWGIYHALVQIGASGQASLDKVAGPVGEALIMTAIGLAVAVPAVLSYNWLVRRNRQNMDLLKNFASGLHTELLASSSKRANTPQT
jgi:biopolymer transport protein ExbB